MEKDYNLQKQSNPNKLLYENCNSFYLLNSFYFLFLKVLIEKFIQIGDLSSCKCSHSMSHNCRNILFHIP